MKLTAIRLTRQSYPIYIPMQCDNNRSPKIFRKLKEPKKGETLEYQTHLRVMKQGSLADS